MNTLLASTAAVCGTLAAGAALCAAPPPSKPNVLFIVADDMNHWVGYTQRNIQTITPNFDRLSKMGASFTQAYCPAPVCNPSRAALMSGVRPSTSGVYNNRNQWHETLPEDKMMTTAFRKAGYYVMGSGKIHHYQRLSEWDDYLSLAIEGRDDPKSKHLTQVKGVYFGPIDAPETEMRDYKVATYAIDQLGKKHDKPFFLAVGFHKPHLPLTAPQKYFDMHPVDGIQLPPHIENDLDDIPATGRHYATRGGTHAEILKTGMWKNAIQAYLACISFTDAQVGRVLDALEKSEYRDNTIVVFWGDHGWHLGEKEHWKKFTLWEEGTRNPLIWRVPGLTKPGSLSKRPVDLMCLYPTLLDLCGIARPAHVEGQNIRPLLADPNAAWDAHALTTFEFNNHAVRTENWRYIRYGKKNEEELYDEANDPYEWKNLAADPKYAAIKNELIKRLPAHNQPEIARRGDGGDDAKEDGAKPTKTEKQDKAAKQAKGESPNSKRSGATQATAPEKNKDAKK